MSVKPLGYNDNIDIGEAEARLQEAHVSLSAVRQRYASKPRFGKKKRISKNDLTTLADILGVLLPLGMQPSVQEQFRTTAGSSECVLCRSAALQSELMLFAAEFENSGVKLLGS